MDLDSYLLGRKIGSGAFGSVYIGQNLVTNKDIAIKMQKLDSKVNRLPKEYKMYKTMDGGQGIPRVEAFGVEFESYVMVMDLLGDSLKDLFVSCARKLSLKTVLMLAEQLITRLEYVHSKNIVHRDINLGNFLMGIGEERNNVYLIDFGMATKYYNEETQEHIPYKENKGFIGNIAFSSLNTHLGVQQSRRDDLESLGFLLLNLLSKLPWSRIKRGTPRNEIRKIVREMKSSISLEDLCTGYPEGFFRYMKYCRELGFDQTPDYSYLRQIFRDLFQQNGFHFDYVYDWTQLDTDGASCETGAVLSTSSEQFVSVENIVVEEATSLVPEADI